MINANLHTLSAVQQSMLQGIDEVHAASVLASRVAAQLVTQHQHLLWQNGPQHTSPYHLSAPSANHIAYNGTVHPTTFAFGTYESDKGAIEDECVHSRARTRAKRAQSERDRTARLQTKFAELEALLLSRPDLCECDQLQDPCKDAILRSAIMTITKLVADTDKLNEQVQSLLSQAVLQE